MPLLIYKNACHHQNIQIHLIIGECSQTSLRETLTCVELINSCKLRTCHLNHSASLATIKEKSLGYLKK